MYIICTKFNAELKLKMMKTRLLIITTVLVGTLLSSCKEDETPAPHIVGEWTLREFAIMNVPADYSYSESNIYEIGDLGYSSYTMSITNDTKYTRSIKGSNGSSTDDSGSWELADDTFSLNSDNIGLSEDFAVDKNENSKLWLSQSALFPLVKDAIRDTITQAFIDEIYADGLTDDEYNLLFDNVAIDFISVFEK